MLGPSGGRAVDAALVGEGRPAHVRLVVVGRDVDDLGHVAGHVGQLGQAAGRDRLELGLEFEVGQDADQVGVAAALAVAVDGALDVPGAVHHRGQRVGHRQLRVVVAVDAPHDLRPAVAGQRLEGGPEDPRQLVGQDAAVRLAQDQRRGARAAGRPQAWPGHRRGRPCSRRSSARRRRSSRGRPRRRRRPSRPTMARFSSGVACRTSRTWSIQLLPKMQTTGVPAATMATRLGSDSARLLRWRVEPKAASRAVLPGDRPGGFEEVDVLGVGARPAALDVRQAELVQAAGDLDLVGQRDDEALALRSVAQRRVVENYSILRISAHRPAPFAPACSAATTASAMACVPTFF